jgi:hypothetical protein
VRNEPEDIVARAQFFVGAASVLIDNETFSFHCSLQWLLGRLQDESDSLLSESREETVRVKSSYQRNRIDEEVLGHQILSCLISDEKVLE